MHLFTKAGATRCLHDTRRRPLHIQQRRQKQPTTQQPKPKALYIRSSNPRAETPEKTGQHLLQLCHGHVPLSGGAPGLPRPGKTPPVAKSLKSEVPLSWLSQLPDNLTQAQAPHQARLSGSFVAPPKSDLPGEVLESKDAELGGDYAPAPKQCHKRQP